MLDLDRYVRAFSSCGEQRLLSSYGAQASHCGGFSCGRIFPVAQTVKNLPAMQETQVRSLGREDPLEKEMATHCSTLAWRIPRTDSWRATVWGHKESVTTE